MPSTPRATSGPGCLPCSRAFAITASRTEPTCGGFPSWRRCSEAWRGLPSTISGSGASCAPPSSHGGKIPYQENPRGENVRYVLALDQGTTSSRALLFDQEGTVRSVAQREFDQIFPQPGWVEHNPEQIATSQISVALLALSNAGLRRDDIAAIGIANQRETAIVWNRETGQPVYNAIVWQDRRTADFCQRLHREGHGSMIQQRTGLLIDSYFSATKIAWILDNVSGARQLAELGKLAFGTVDSWLVWKLTHGAVHA